MADRERFLRFDHEHRDGLHVYVARPTEAELPGPAWTGLWERDYPEEPHRNPWRRYAINNNDGEALAVWRALTLSTPSGLRPTSGSSLAEPASPCGHGRISGNAIAPGSLACSNSTAVRKGTNSDERMDAVGDCHPAAWP